MQSFLELYTQNNILPIRLISPSFGRIAPEKLAAYGLTHRKPHYFLVFMVSGSTTHGVDLQEYVVKKHELLFMLPDQMHALPVAKKGTDYFKLNFDEYCLSRLPRHYPFLIDPYNHQQIQFSIAASRRLQSNFEILQELLSVADTDPALILSYLNTFDGD